MTKSQCSRRDFLAQVQSKYLVAFHDQIFFLTLEAHRLIARLATKTAPSPFDLEAEQRFAESFPRAHQALLDGLYAEMSTDEGCDRFFNLALADIETRVSQTSKDILVKAQIEDPIQTMKNKIH